MASRGLADDTWPCPQCGGCGNMGGRPPATCDLCRGHKRVHVYAIGDEAGEARYVERQARQIRPLVLTEEQKEAIAIGARAGLLRRR